jgi:hypothetical protein
MNTCGDKVYEEPIPALNTCLEKCGDSLRDRVIATNEMPGR